MVRINVINQNKKKRINLKLVKKTIRFVLKRLNRKKRKIDLNIIFVKDAYIKRLNRIYKHKGYATDVLCFCISGTQTDIFISTDRALANSRRFKTSFINELNLYVIHGILHMFGFRDGTRSERKKMERVQDEILRELKT